MRQMFFSGCGKFKKLVFFVLILVFDFFCVVAKDGYYSWDFSDCDIKDILFAVSIDTGISIVPDDTVSGKGSLKFAGKEFDAAFEAFLKSERLFVSRERDVWTVSRYSLRKEGNLLYLDVCDLTPVQVVEKLSKSIKGVLTFDSLPAQRISVHFSGITEENLVESLAKQIGGYTVVRGELGYHLAKKNENRRVEFGGSVLVEKIDDGFSVDLRECSFTEVVERLFEIEKFNGTDVSFCLLGCSDAKIQRSVFIGENFSDTLKKLCLQAGCNYVFEGDLFYFFADSNSKSEIISGTRNWRKFQLRYTKPQDIFSFIFKRVGKLETIALPDETAFLCCASEKESLEIQNLLSEVDVKQSVYLVNLKYIKPCEFVEHLPPCVEKNALFFADDNNSLYFRGTEEAYKNMCSQIELCDRPVKRLTYDLLILQYDETGCNTWSSSFDCKRVSAGDKNNISVVLGSVTSFNLNIVTSFGLVFAAELQSSIEENKTKVFADTTLHGVSGKQISFQNTNTYRYRDNNVDPQTGKPVYSGVTREISSGIKLDVLGWVSGDNQITSRVTASVSRQGTDMSAQTGNPPPTSEKILTTEVCGKSGEPVVLSGLFQTADSLQQKRTPFLSKIPIIGQLFKSKKQTNEQSQMVIYLVPHLDNQKAEKNEQNFTEEWAKERIENLIEIIDEK